MIGTPLLRRGTADVLRLNQKRRIPSIVTNYLLDLETFFRDTDLGRRQAVQRSNGRQLIWRDHVK
jgi:hypothetical protein